MSELVIHSLKHTQGLAYVQNLQDRSPSTCHCYTTTCSNNKGLQKNPGKCGSRPTFQELHFGQSVKYQNTRGSRVFKYHSMCQHRPWLIEEKYVN